MDHGNESAPLARREVDRDIMQVTTREIDRDIMQIRMAMHEDDANLRHLVERLRDGDPDLTWILGRLRDEGEELIKTLSALVHLLDDKPYLVEVLRRLARPRSTFKRLLEPEQELET